jgi:hypothetical protein
VRGVRVRTHYARFRRAFGSNLFDSDSTLIGVVMHNEVPVLSSSSFWFKFKMTETLKVVKGAKVDTEGLKVKLKILSV